MQNPLDISVSTKPQYDNANGHNVISPSLSTSGDSTYSPSLAEGARGWVDTTSASQAKSATASKHSTSVIASEQSERGNPQETSAQRIDCHANASAFARNDEKSAHNDESFHAFANAKDTHPQTPSAREGASREPNTVTLREGTLGKANSAVCHTEGVARSISKDSADNAKSSRDISLSLNMTTKNE